MIFSEIARVAGATSWTETTSASYLAAAAANIGKEVAVVPVTTKLSARRGDKQAQSRASVRYDAALSASHAGHGDRAPTLQHRSRAHDLAKFGRTHRLHGQPPTPQKCHLLQPGILLDFLQRDRPF